MAMDRTGIRGDRVYSASIALARLQNELRVRLGGRLGHDGRELGIVVMLPATAIIDDSAASGYLTDSCARTNSGVSTITFLSGWSVASSCSFSISRSSAE